MLKKKTLEMFISVAFFLPKMHHRRDLKSIRNIAVHRSICSLNRHGNHTGDLSPILSGPLRKTLQSFRTVIQKCNDFSFLNFQIWRGKYPCAACNFKLQSSDFLFFFFCPLIVEKMKKKKELTQSAVAPSLSLFHTIPL